MHASKATSCAATRTAGNVGEEHYGALIQRAQGELKALREVQVYLDTSGTGTGLDTEAPAQMPSS